MKKITFNLENNSLKTIYEWYKWNWLDWEPKYQREFIWNSQFKAELILSILKGYPIGAFVWKYDPKANKKRYEIIDGQQRLRTIINFITGCESGQNRTFIGKARQEIIQHVKDDYDDGKFDTDMENTFSRKHLNKWLNNNISVKFDNLPESYKLDIYSFQVSCVSLIAETPDKVISQYFRVLQNQDKLRAGEIMNARPHSQFDEIFTKMEKPINDFSKKKIIFNDIRREFTKLFIGNIGLISDELALGTDDKSIQKYFEKNENKLIISDELQEQIEQFIKYIESINNDSNFREIKLGKGWKRFIKLFLFLYFDYKIELNNIQLQKLSILNKMLAIYASNKKESEQKDTWNNNQEQIDLTYEQGYEIFDLCRGRKTYDKVKKSLKNLNDWIIKWK